MNYISHVNGFLGRVSRDYRLNPTHISLYLALFQQWNLHRFRNPISIAREEVMATSRIHSRVTYHKCLRELHAWGFLHYMPSYNHYRGSLVYLLDFSEGQGGGQLAVFCTGTERGLYRKWTGVGPFPKQDKPFKPLRQAKGRARAQVKAAKRMGRSPKAVKEKKKVAPKKKRKGLRRSRPRPGGGAALFLGECLPGGGGPALLSPLQRQRVAGGQPAHAGLAGGGLQMGLQRLQPAGSRCGGAITKSGKRLCSAPLTRRKASPKSACCTGSRNRGSGCTGSTFGCTRRTRHCWAGCWPTSMQTGRRQKRRGYVFGKASCSQGPSAAARPA
ncbi:hypothetical protein K3G39_19250 [Pontibacter sp. HSC-14F20]|nr:hypothetical protein [Pontibacter sp. HSC-14F20]